MLDFCESRDREVPGRGLFEHVLLLNASFEPLNVIGWRRAVKLIVLDKAEIVEASEREIHTVTRSVAVPSVVRLTTFVRFQRREAKFSRRNIYTRDAFTCQYCGRRLAVSELTCDHVMPRSRGGRTEWSNIVTCCVPCNRRKGGRTPAEAGLHLMRMPRQPTWLWGVQNRFATRRPPQAWSAYLYMERDREAV
ncbi:MAG TPA: HNH endonuclease [Candidatus Krumholzibacteria bacterium]|nr:HNH endonuclease [Candidatus Krumholzibacteria bacterium]